MSVKFYYTDSLSDLRLKDDGREVDARNLRSLYSRAWKCIRSYEASIEPYLTVQQKLNSNLQRCQDEHAARRIEKQMLRNGLFMLQTFLHIEKGHRYAPNDEDCKKYGIVRNPRYSSYSSFSNGYTGHSFDDFNVLEARTNPMLKSLKKSCRDAIQDNMDHISSHNKHLFDRVRALNLRSVHGCFEINSDEVCIGSLRAKLNQNSPTLWISDQKVSVPEWNSSQYEMFFADEATAQEQSNDFPTAERKQLKEKLDKLRLEEKPMTEKRNLEEKPKIKRRRIIDDDDSE